MWRAIEQLRELGLQITGHPATGYQLNSVPDLLLPEILGPLAQGTMFGSRIHHYFRVGSTNLAAMQAAAAGEPEGAVFVGEQQTAGRGRGGHSWESAQSVGIYCSVVLRPVLPPADALLLSLIAGIAVAEAVEQTTGLHPDLRWPNDVLLDGRKFCGVLTEMNAEPTRVRYVVVGVGINVNQASFSGELEAIATSLRIQTGREWSRVELAAALLKSLDSEYRKLIEGGAARARSHLAKGSRAGRRSRERAGCGSRKTAAMRASPKASTSAASCWCAATRDCALCSRAEFARLTESNPCFWSWMSAIPTRSSASSKPSPQSTDCALRAADCELARQPLSRPRRLTSTACCSAICLR